MFTTRPELLGTFGVAAYRKFKPPFSLTAALSPALQALNCTVFGDDFGLSMIIWTPHGPEAAHCNAI